MAPTQNLGAALARARKRSGVSVTAIAKMIGASRISVHNWLAQRTKPSKAYEARLIKVIAKLEARA